MGPELAFTRRIPGLKIETWGTRPFSLNVARMTDPPLSVLFLGGVILGGRWGLGETEQVGEEAVGSGDALG
jgi:hypothetical protein